MKRFRITLRGRIFFAMILIILVSFLVTGLIYFQHFKKENEFYHQERLKRKEYAINESINYFLRQETVNPHTDSIVRAFDTKICELASINKLDINIYSLNGSLLISSNPDLYQKGILPEYLEAHLLQQLSDQPEELLMQYETDSSRYLSTFDYVTNSQDEPIAIVNLPYFDTENVHQNDQQHFLTRLGQTYFFLFVAAGLLAYFLSNYITGSLQAIGDKLKSTRINGDNEPLKWRFDDEIGTLVDEYNLMLKKLQKSATALAKTERESAWKQMAKQVAHEIKNPLTPMRLNVQYLQRSLKTEDKARLDEFTEGMISQIDTLSNIAEAFSRFASMPELQLQTFNVQEVIKSATAIYPAYKIQCSEEDSHIRIKGDKTQLVRVMNNLINNAIQAVPEGTEPHIQIEVSTKDTYVIIAVKDNGVGIAEEQKDKIFEPRFTTKTKGMGLGLAMVKNIVNNMGGKVWFNTKLNQGTSFYVSLPAV